MYTEHLLLGCERLPLKGDGGKIIFHQQNIYDDNWGQADPTLETAAIQQNIRAAAASTDPHNWFITGTNRATSLWYTSGDFANGTLPSPYPPHGYNQVALDQISQVTVIHNKDQRTVGVLSSDFPNDKPGYIQAIIDRNRFRGVGAHFYTTSLTERDNAILKIGFDGEGIACFVLPAPAAGAVPLHRLAAGRDHLYTTSDTERDALKKAGWHDEGEAGYVFPTQAQGTQPLHRLYNKGIGEHFYTTSDTERDNAINHLGFASEGEACYVYAADPSGATAFYRLQRLAPTSTPPF